jgi:hypothetical protein
MCQIRIRGGQGADQVGGLPFGGETKAVYRCHFRSDERTSRMKTSSLSFRWRDDTFHRYGEPPTPLRFLDFEIDGVSLWNALRDRGHEEIGWLGVYDDDREPSAIRRLLLREPPEPWFHNPELYVCPGCADLGCGAITVRVERSDGFFTWREFVAEKPIGPLDRPRGSVEPFEYEVVEGLGPYHFAEAAYEQALAYATTLTKTGK